MCVRGYTHVPKVCIQDAPLVAFTVTGRNASTAVQSYEVPLAYQIPHLTSTTLHTLQLTPPPPPLQRNQPTALNTKLQPPLPPHPPRQHLLTPFSRRQPTLRPPAPRNAQPLPHGRGPARLALTNRIPRRPLQRHQRPLVVPGGRQFGLAEDRRSARVRVVEDGFPFGACFALEGGR
ncbi:uncharacterized protein J3D65DRAFT_50388 [Phyllosticta citribraziliensis]|uniref:Uncharacterized protein n=1 Tax=Phyllosticta citribraziliensis TaxID=989973 RepID=A0ABR1MBA6_9PEZI